MKKRSASAVVLAMVLSAALPAAAYAENTDSQVASAEEMITPQDVVDEDMVPIYGDKLQDGTYSMEVRSSSSMFSIIDCQLTVIEGEMKAALTLSGDGYLKLYMGTGEEAVKASEEDYITFELNGEGKQVYEVPVEALDMGIDCAAFSKRKQKWYDRVLVFTSESLPQEAFKEFEMTDLEELNLEDGIYQVGVSLEGASGKTAVESPAVLKVENGTFTATVIWSSSKYDYMLVDGEKYLPVNTEGNASFEIPLTGMDYRMPVTIDSTALGKPRELDYVLYFDSASIVKE